MKGGDLVYKLPLTIREIHAGTQKTVSFQHGTDTQSLTVKIPAGMVTGRKLRVPGKGEQSAYGGPPGDLYIESQVMTDPVFRLEGHHVYLDREVKLSDALLGARLTVTTLDDKELSLKMPPGTRHGTKMRLSGRGIPYMNSSRKGDLFVHILISMPRNLSEEQKKAVEQLAALGL